MSFLDKDGLAYLWNKIGEKLAAIPKTMTVNVTYGNDVYTADKTFAEILAAINGGQMVRAVLDGTTYFNDVTLLNGPSALIFFSTVENVDQLRMLLVNSNNIWTNLFKRVSDLSGVDFGRLVKVDPEASNHFVGAVPGTDYMTPVPVTAEDNGKVFTVVNGQWGAYSLLTEPWTFTLENGSEVTKNVVTGAGGQLL